VDLGVVAETRLLRCYHERYCFHVMITMQLSFDLIGFLLKYYNVHWVGQF